MFAHRGHDVSLFFSFEEEAARFREGCDANDGVTVKYLDTEYKGKPLVRIDPGGAAAVNRGRVQLTSLHLERRRIGGMLNPPTSALFDLFLQHSPPI